MRLIDADALTERINDHLEMAREMASATEITHDMIVYANTGYMVKEFLKTQPTIEPKKGKWIADTFRPWKIVCSECGSEALLDVDCSDYLLTDYCPNCGARMEGEK